MHWNWNLNLCLQLIQFIVTLVQNNRILNLKRKRPLLMSTNGKKPKYIHQIYEEDMDLNKVAHLLLLILLHFLCLCHN